MRNIFWLLLTLIVAALIATSAKSGQVPGIKQAAENQQINNVCFEENCFDVGLAITPEQHRQGLMHKKYLAEKEGLLFVFPQEEKYRFWMKDTLIPLDIIWIDSQKKVVHINRNTSVCGSENCPTIVPSAPAKYVLEINAGLADKMNLKENDKINFNKKSLDYP